MSETPPHRPLASRGHRNRVPGVEICGTCKRKLDNDAGVCRDCLDRSRIVDGDELGGEC